MVAETYEISSRAELELIKSAIKRGGLKDIFTNLMLTREDSALKLDAAASGVKVQDKIDNMPNFREDNTACLIYRSNDGKDRVLIINEAERFYNLLNFKGRTNPYTSTFEGFKSTPDKGRFIAEKSELALAR